eukprot:TRINITY_DN2960_c0_g2_i9.p1 TRINITY_DN2960_c0_g2~~TRINITY_DN2960_c0_g2_i9.p1  ORF type:complete len:309 (+),score=40.51 TRINITY_DN2960_c0_g2_i9:717-1643(+)
MAMFGHLPRIYRYNLRTQIRLAFLLAVTRSGEGGGQLVVGFAAVIRFFVAPNRCRLRVGHVMVPPVFQKGGVGCALVKRINQWAKEVEAIDVTYEDPSEAMQFLREKIDVQRCLQLDWTKQAISKVLEKLDNGVKQPINGNSSFSTNDSEGLQLPKAIRSRMQTDLKISRQQAMKVWEDLVWINVCEQKKQQCLENYLWKLIFNRLSGNGRSVRKYHNCFLDRGSILFSGKKIRMFVMMKCDKVVPQGAKLVKVKDKNETIQMLEEQWKKQVSERFNELQIIQSKISYSLVNGNHSEYNMNKNNNGKQ